MTAGRIPRSSLFAVIAKRLRASGATVVVWDLDGSPKVDVTDAASIQAALRNIKKVDVVEYPELGMEAIWKIEVQDFPAFILVDDKGNDFFVNGCGACVPTAKN